MNVKENSLRKIIYGTTNLLERHCICSSLWYVLNWLKKGEYKFISRSTKKDNHSHNCYIEYRLRASQERNIQVRKSNKQLNYNMEVTTKKTIYQLIVETKAINVSEKVPCCNEPCMKVKNWPGDFHKGLHPISEFLHITLRIE